MGPATREHLIPNSTLTQRKPKLIDNLNSLITAPLSPCFQFFVIQTLLNRPTNFFSGLSPINLVMLSCDFSVLLFSVPAYYPCFIHRHSLQIVSIRVNYIRRVVRLATHLTSYPWLTIVLPSFFQTKLKKRIHSCEICLFLERSCKS